jgi:hypothetical protein
VTHLNAARREPLLHYADDRNLASLVLTAQLQGYDLADDGSALRYCQESLLNLLGYDAVVELQRGGLSAVPGIQRIPYQE